MNKIRVEEHIIINDEMYVIRKKALKMLNTTVKHMPRVVEYFSIRYTKEGSNNYYNVNDINKVIDEGKAFYDAYYRKEEIEKTLNFSDQKWDYKRFIVAQLSTPEKYMRILYNEKVLYDKKIVNKIITQSNNANKKIASTQEIMYLGKGYYTEDKTRKILGFRANNNTFNTVCDELNISSISVGQKSIDEKLKDLKVTLYEAESVNNVDREFRDYLSNLLSTHYTNKQVDEILTPKLRRENLTPINIEEKYIGYLKKNFNIPNGTFLYNKQKVEELKERLDSAYTLSEIVDMFNMSIKRAKQVVEEYECEWIYDGRRSTGAIKVYFKESIDELLSKKKKYDEEYMSFGAIGKYFGTKEVPSVVYENNLVKKYKVPLYAYDKTYKGGSDLSCKISDAKRAGDEFKERKVLASISDITMETPYKTFKARLDAYIKWDGFNDENAYTEETWYSYVKSWLNRTEMTGFRLNGLINRLVYVTPIIKEFLNRTNKDEIYMLTTNEINLVMRSIELDNYFRAVYLFLREVAIDRNSKGLTTVFKIAEVIDTNPHTDVDSKSKNNEKKDEIYTFEEYSAVFTYCTDIETRIKYSIEEIETKGRYTYLSLWLYTMLHLNNAWRHGDVKDFPKLPVDDILDRNNITDINWFKENKIDIGTARSIVFKVNQKEFTMSKTKINGSFFCSDELAPAFATAILMLSIAHKYLDIESDYIMIFGTKDNRINETMVKNFFKQIGIKGFVFASMKFNKTVMTFIYYVANLTGDSKALVYAMKLRAHIEADTTSKYYLKMDIQTIEELSKQLFRRGEFGYVASLLVKKINGGKLSFGEITEEVEQFRQAFGSVAKLNRTVGFMNDLKMRRMEVFEQIDSMSLQTAQESYTNVFTRNSPSKDSIDIQCLLGRENCNDTSMECCDCQYHIPTIYMLTDLAKRIKVTIKKCVESDILPEKFKLSLSVERKKQIIIEAIAKFGPEVVYSYLGMTKDEFLELLELVPLPDEFKLLTAN